MSSAGLQLDPHRVRPKPERVCLECESRNTIRPTTTFRVISRASDARSVIFFFRSSLGEIGIAGEKSLPLIRSESVTTRRVYVRKSTRNVKRVLSKKHLESFPPSFSLALRVSDGVVSPVPPPRVYTQVYVRGLPAVPTTALIRVL